MSDGITVDANSELTDIDLCVHRNTEEEEEGRFASPCRPYLRLLLLVDRRFHSATTHAEATNKNRHRICQHLLLLLL
uniref:Uncharacterized protein n=1 Tax=Syphacia muris TaxID=451379 RepID=A0A0N5AQD8_9BILA